MTIHIHLQVMTGYTVHYHIDLLASYSVFRLSLSVYIFGVYIVIIHNTHSTSLQSKDSILMIISHFQLACVSYTLLFTLLI
jgi:hypothetical protein